MKRLRPKRERRYAVTFLASLMPGVMVRARGGKTFLKKKRGKWVPLITFSGPPSDFAPAKVSVEVQFLFEDDKAANLKLVDAAVDELKMLLE